MALVFRGRLRWGARLEAVDLTLVTDARAVAFSKAGRTPVPLWPIHAGLGEDVQRGQGRDQAVGAGLWQGSANLNFVATGDRPWLLPGPVPTPVVGGPRLPPSAFQFVFYRDPLERFLSTFLDKCAGWRIVEGHCEPISIFGIGGWEEAKKQNPRTDPMSLLLPPRKGTRFLARRSDTAGCWNMLGLGALLARS